LRLSFGGPFVSGAVAASLQAAFHRLGWAAFS